MARHLQGLDERAVDRVPRLADLELRREALHAKLFFNSRQKAAERRPFLVFKARLAAKISSCKLLPSTSTWKRWCAERGPNCAETARSTHSSVDLRDNLRRFFDVEPGSSLFSSSSKRLSSSVASPPLVGSGFSSAANFAAPPPASPSSSSSYSSSSCPSAHWPKASAASGTSCGAELAEGAATGCSGAAQAISPPFSPCSSVSGTRAARAVIKERCFSGAADMGCSPLPDATFERPFGAPARGAMSSTWAP
jgi:hypothetical protein